MTPANASGTHRVSHVGRTHLPPVVWRELNFRILNEFRRSFGVPGECSTFQPPAWHCASERELIPRTGNPARHPGPQRPHPQVGTTDEVDSTYPTPDILQILKQPLTFICAAEHAKKEKALAAQILRESQWGSQALNQDFCLVQSFPLLGPSGNGWRSGRSSITSRTNVIFWSEQKNAPRTNRP